MGVNLGSPIVARPPHGRFGYVASKAAVEAMTRALAADLGRDGIRVNCIRPGIIPSELRGSTEIHALLWRLVAGRRCLLRNLRSIHHRFEYRCAQRERVICAGACVQHFHAIIHRHDEPIIELMPQFHALRPAKASRAICAECDT